MMIRSAVAWCPGLYMLVGSVRMCWMRQSNICSLMFKDGPWLDVQLKGCSDGHKGVINRPNFDFMSFSASSYLHLLSKAGQDDGLDYGGL
eukprot:8461071-Ditylum_brightwellii.AAC.1